MLFGPLCPDQRMTLRAKDQIYGWSKIIVGSCSRKGDRHTIYVQKKWVDFTMVGLPLICPIIITYFLTRCLSERCYILSVIWTTIICAHTQLNTHPTWWHHRLRYTLGWHYNTFSGANNAIGLILLTWILATLLAIVRSPLVFLLHYCDVELFCPHICIFYPQHFAHI